MGFVWFTALWFAVLTVIFLAVSAYSRSVRRERLEKAWAEDNPGGDLAAREAYVEAGMEKYLSGFRRRLILLLRRDVADRRRTRPVRRAGRSRPPPRPGGPARSPAGPTARRRHVPDRPGPARRGR